MSDTCVIYARISDDHDGLSLGVQRQIDDCRALAERLGKRVVGEPYIDNDISAWSGKKRPDYLRMYHDLERGAAPPCVLAWHNDRLNRKPRELLDWIDMAKPRGVVVHTVQAGVIDLSTPTGVAVAITLAAWAEQESAHKGERVRAKRQQKARAGEPNITSRRPFGYERDGITLIPDEALALAQAYESILDGMPVNAVLARWNRAGVTTTAGNPWRVQTLKKTMCNPRYAGLATYLGDVVTDATWPPLVPRSIWETAVLRLTPKAGQKRMPKYLGSGLYRCPCGQAMAAAWNNGVRSYRCQSRAIPGVRGSHVSRAGEPLDDYVREVVSQYLSRPDTVNAAREETRTHVDVGDLQREVRAKEAKLSQLADMFDSDEIDRAEYGRLRDRNREAITELNEQITTALRGSASASFVAAGPDPTGRFLSADLATQRAVLADLVTVDLLFTGKGAGFDPRFVKINPARGGSD